MNVSFQTTLDFHCMDKKKKTFFKICSEQYEGEYIMTEFEFFGRTVPLMTITRLK